MSAARNKRRRYKKRGRFGFLYKMLSVIAIVAAVFMGATVFFRVERVEVTGNIRYDAAQIEQASGVVHGDNLFRLNKYDTAARIRRTLPYVESVNIRRRLPDTLVLNVNECIAAAQLSSGDGGWLMRLFNGLSLLLSTLFVTGLTWLWTKIGTLLVMKSSRANEYEADAFSFRLGYGDELCALLDTICGSSAKGLFANLASSHPGKEKRIQKLRQLGARY